MRKRLATAVVLVLAVGLFASPAPAQVTEKVLPNGLKALIMEDHKAPVACVQVWYRVGSRNENFDTAGISHLLEHMMFKGTRKYGPGEYSRIIQKNGGTDNAFTTKDFTVYFVTLAADRAGLDLELEADRMRNLSLKESDIGSETQVVMEERRMRFDDDPQTSLYEEVNASAFMAHPYHWPVIGWMTTIKNITPKDLRRYYARFYAPNNAFIVVAGDVNAAQTMGLIEKYFGGLTAAPAPEQRIPVEPPQRGIREVRLKKQAGMPYLFDAYHAPRLPDKDAYALIVLDAVLSGGKSSRLYRSLVYEKQTALSAFSDYDGMDRDPFEFALGGTPAVGHTAAELEAAIRKEVEAIGETPPSEFEMQKAKNQIESAFVLQQDSVFAEARLLGEFEMLGDWRMKDIYLEEIKKVTAEDVSRAARKYLTEDNLTSGVLIPEKQ
ncbi:MAG: pitrilysin family protein [Nitrospiraceae bacterium]|nr:pitrilysin family protein [Nitrospiraceae bacterium]